jgi:hypothetical protein
LSESEAVAGSLGANARARRASAAFLLVCVVAAIGFVFDVLDARHPATLAGPPLIQVMMLSFPVVGLLIARREPRNPIGWILLGIGLAWALSAALGGYAAYSLLVRPGSLPGGAVADASSAWLWVPAVVPMGTFLLLLFPDGRLLSPRWRWVMWCSGAVMLAVALAITFEPRSLAEDGFPGVSNPLGVSALEPLLTVFRSLLFVIPACFVASATGLVIRFRRSTGIQRLQLKWLVAAAATVAMAFAAALVATGGQGWGQPTTAGWILAIQNAALVSFALIPASIGVAILRYRLYDIDRLLSRTLTYALLTALLVAVYALIVVVVSAVTGRTNSPVVIAGSTLVVAALFGPARRRIQRLIDRRFFRRGYDAERVLTAFSARLRDELDLESVSGELRTAVAGAVQPSRVGVWIRRTGGNR